jgi:hypothetical protein
VVLTNIGGSNNAAALNIPIEGVAAILLAHHCGDLDARIPARERGERPRSGYPQTTQVLSDLAWDPEMEWLLIGGLVWPGRRVAIERDAVLTRSTLSRIVLRQRERVKLLGETASC